MNKKLINMHKNIAQLRKLDFCRIISQSKHGFLVEVEVREGKYKILLDYKHKGYVDSYLIEPEIRMEDYLEIHTYGMKYHSAYKKAIPQLCLDRPFKNEWNTSIALIDSYIPWAAEWTEFYELWELTGVWHGGGEHPSDEKVEVYFEEYNDIC